MNPVFHAETLQEAAATARGESLPLDPLPGLIEQALELLPYMPDDTDEKYTLATTVSKAIRRQIESAWHPAMIVDPALETWEAKIGAKIPAGI